MAYAKKYCKASDRLLECEECEKRFPASCSKLGDDELLRIESGDGAWYCSNCKADCSLCSGTIDNIYVMIYGPSEDSDQPGLLPSLIRVFNVHMKKPWVLSYPLSTQRRL